jgi:RNA polymerase-binding transcription factor DksA
MPKSKEREVAKPVAKAKSGATAKSAATSKPSTGRVVAPAKTNGAGKAPAPKGALKSAPKAAAAAAATKPANGRSDKAKDAKDAKDKAERIEPGTAEHAKEGTGRAAKSASDRHERGTNGNGSDRAERERLLALKSPFPKDELSRWRQQLIEKRNTISSDIAGLEKDAMEAEDGHTTPNHIAERGSDADLQDVSLGIAGEEKDIIWQIDRALRKIEASQPLPFGLCEYTKSPIPRTRLQLIPWTPLSFEGATYMETNGLKVEDLLVDG